MSEIAADAKAQPGQDLVRLHAIAAAEHGDREIARHFRHEVPIGTPGVRLLGRAAVNRHGGSAGVLLGCDRGAVNADPEICSA